jgi:glycosyltransferase involved in cell wall biosynthesis
MGRVGHFLVTHLLMRAHYRVHFYPWKLDPMAGRWPENISRLVVGDTKDLDIDQAICFCSVLDARQEHFARLTTPWIFYELSSLPSEVVENLNSNDAVYVTSSFVRQTFLDQGVVVPMTVVGHGFDPRHYRFSERVREGEFIFLCIAEDTPRKNLPMLVRCFERAFENRTGVRLVLKLGMHGEGGLRRQIKRRQKVTLLTEEIADDTGLAELYRSAHCFVLPTRGEGFGLPMLEAMATGLPVIVTDYGGQLDFCNEANSFLIRNKGLVDTDPDCFPHIESQWADPDEEHLIHLMRYVYENYERALQAGRLGYQTASADWTWDKQLGRVLP